jgi:hypothetical protein
MFNLLRLTAYYPTLPTCFRRKIFDQLEFEMDYIKPIPERIQEAHFCLSQIEKDFKTRPMSVAPAVRVLSQMKELIQPGYRDKWFQAFRWLKSSPIKGYIHCFDAQLLAASNRRAVEPRLFKPLYGATYNCVHAAVYRDLPGLISTLTKGYPNLINETSEGGWSPLHEAVLLGRVHCVKELLKQGANVNKISEKGGTPLTLLMMIGSRSREILILLLSNNADPWIPNNAMYRTAPVHSAAESWPEALKILLEKDPQLVLARDSTMATPLQLAATAGNVQNIRLLLQYGSDINSVDIDGATPLHNCWAILQRRTSRPGIWGGDSIAPYREAREILISSGAELERRNRYGHKPSTWAFAMGYIIQSVLNLGSTPDLMGSGQLSWESALSNAPAAWRTQQ